jgi:ABC-type sugar transport system permease subunit
VPGPAGRRGGALVAWAFLAPFLLPFLLFWILPIVHGLYVSFTNASLTAVQERFVGLENYRRLLGDPVYRRSLANTVLFVVENVPLLVVGGLLLALLLNRALPGLALIRAAFVAPYLITASAVAIIWQFVLDPTTGLLNVWLAQVGLPAQQWLNEPGQAMGAIVLITLWWRVGFPFLVLLAGLQEIPGELHEAAKLDGAGAWQRFWRITLPLLAPVLFFVLIIRFIDSFKVFAQVYLVTGGGPVGSTRVLLQYLYEVGFQDFRSGYAAAIGWSLFLIILAVTAVQMRLLRRYGTHE